MSPSEVISPSQLFLYLTCSLKYRFQYVDRLPKPFRAAAAALGSSIHKALEWLHKERKQGRNPALADLLRTFEADWYGQTVGLELRWDEEPEEKLLLKAKELLSQYHCLPARAVQDAEVHFQVPLVNPATGEALDLPLRGVIDLIEADGAIVEFKSPQRKPPETDLPDNLQLTAYSYAYELLFGKPPKELRRVSLVRTKTPKIETQITGREKRDYERLFHIAKEALKGIRAGVFVPNRGCFLCADCEFFQDCQEWTGNEEVSDGHA